MNGKGDANGEVARALAELRWDSASVVVARGFLARLLGFTAYGRDAAMSRRLVLVFPHCNAVHTCFMRYPLNIAFLRGDGSVARVEKGVLPWRFRSCKAAAFTMERASGP